MKRRTFLSSMAAASAAAMAGCGGSGDSGPIAPAAAATVVDNPDKQVGFYGDSTSAGAQTLNGRLYNTVNSEPAMVQAAIQQWFNRTDIRCVNNGVGGTQASQLLNGTDGVHPPFPQQMAASKESIVLLNFLLNDSYYANVQPPVAGMQIETPDVYYNTMGQLIQIAQRAGKTVVLQEPNPIQGVQGPTSVIYPYLDALRSCATHYGVPLVPQFDAFLQLPGWIGWISEDGVHPKDEGYAWKAWNTFSTLLPVIKNQFGI